MREDNELFHKFAEVKGHPNYGVNALGEVVNLKTGRILKPDKSHRDYQKIDLDGTKYYIHRLVAEIFVPGKEGRRYVIHKNGNNADNFFKNLEWSNDLKRGHKNFPHNRT